MPKGSPAGNVLVRKKLNLQMNNGWLPGLGSPLEARWVHLCGMNPIICIKNREPQAFLIEWA